VHQGREGIAWSNPSSVPLWHDITGERDFRPKLQQFVTKNRAPWVIDRTPRRRVQRVDNASVTAASGSAPP